MNYTQGEWKVTKDGLVWAKIAQSCWKPRIALLEFDNPQFEADANLIAAAPEMYEALKEVLNSRIEYLEYRYENPDSYIDVQKAKQALAKAEGK